MIWKWLWIAQMEILPLDKQNEKWNILIQARVILNCTALAVIDLVTGDSGIDFFLNATQEAKISSKWVYVSKLSQNMLSEWDEKNH